ncbi:glucose-6-phosphate 1-dehydrogenase [Brevibacterium sanguinis]|uniref:Glucose-6-phosphate 1-dehydrogenase n=2 Tax=Brevibacterium TaxID=1696 RepID=A0A366IPY5_9MICO|nr:MULTISPECIES: glucose-6-phosphate dehydrogenase [Brevibacterium]RBP67158.1 glucose-6-phosphate 1-dehydrogenase [Brevibacterium sanguinis]RBP73683.1 glucose-6-phosphate 1-dehydrogenase [Brevibacterium celere]
MSAITNLVILGATGDLTSRLLLPGLGTLLAQRTDRRVTLIGSSQTADDSWSSTVAEAFDSVGADGPAVDHVLETTTYVQCDVTKKDDMAELLGSLDGATCLYFALPPSVTMKSLDVLAELDLPQDLLLALEKPIGTDFESAQELNLLASRLVSEQHIFRVDHFLGMPAVLNFLGMRFANRILEPLLNRDNVESIEIVFDETLGLEGRAGFYDPTGATRDMIQSHLLQVMGLMMMDPPARFDHVELPALTAHILRATRIWGDDPGRSIVRGRYTAGTVGGVDLPDYTAEEGVDPDNGTETFVQVTLEVDTWRWSGVPVTLRSGKAIGNPRQEIVVRFRQPPHIYPQFPNDGNVPENVLRLEFEQDQVLLELNMGGPFDSRGMTRVTAQTDTAAPELSAYGSVLRGILDGDPTMSVRGDAAEEGWRITGEILDAFADGSVPLREYEAGSSGPV